jgi:beta propeller repeat protein
VRRTRHLPIALVLALALAMATPASALTFAETHVVAGPTFDSQGPDMSGRYLVYESYSGAGSEWDIWVDDLRSGLTVSATNTNDGFDQRNPKISGTRVVYEDWSEADSEIWVFDLNAFTRNKITGNGVDDVAPDIDGNLVAWASNIVPPITLHWYDLETHTGGQVPGTSHPNGMRVDNRRIVYYDDKDGDWGVFVYNVDTGQEEKVASAAFAAADLQETAIWGPYAAWSRNAVATPDNMDIWASDLRTGDVPQITSNINTQRYPSIHGNRIAWQDDRNGNQDIFVWDRSELGSSQVVIAAGDQLYPANFGNRVAWQDERAGAPQSQIRVASTTYETRRMSGVDRYATALDIAGRVFIKAPTVVLATGANFPDALTASGLAGAYQAPLLLTPQASAPATLLAELATLEAVNVVIVGGESAVSANVRAQLETAGYTVERLAGADRYETAKQVAYRIMDVVNVAGSFRQEAFFVRGDAFPDALAVAPHAYARKVPILLVRPTSVPAATSEAIQFCSIKRGWVIGSASAVADATKASVDAKLVANAGLATKRWAGADRYATAVACAQAGISSGWLDLDVVGIATGTNFPDALGGGAACGFWGSPILLTQKAAIPTALSTFFASHQQDFGGLWVFGSTAAITDGVMSGLETAMD